MIDIILIQPKAGPYDMLGARVPYGLLSIASIPHRKGYKIKIIDQRTDHLWEKTLIESLKQNPICVGITCMTGGQIRYALHAAKIVRENSKSPIVWGGVHPSLLPSQTLENPYVDIIVVKEGDNSFLEVIEAIKNKKPLSKIKGIWYKENGKIFSTPEREFIKNLDTLPEIPYELIDTEKYASLHLEEGRSLDFITSRGCPFNCSFCYNQFFNKSRWRAMSAKESVKRLAKVVRKYNIKAIYFQDDNFCANIERLKEICKGIIDEKLNIIWGTLGLRIDTAMKMDDEVLNLMVKSGCRNVDIGAESGSQEILDMIDKKIKVQEIINANRKLSKYPFIIKYTFMIGFPGETDKQVMQTVNLALKLCKENKNAYTPFAVYTPYPGTTLYHKASKAGFTPPKRFEDWADFSIDNWALYFKSWNQKSRIRRLNSISFTSLFSNKNIIYKINKPLTRFLFSLYYPFARFRFKFNFHTLPIESMLGRVVLKHF